MTVGLQWRPGESNLSQYLCHAPSTCHPSARNRTRASLQKRSRSVGYVARGGHYSNLNLIRGVVGIAGEEF
jgi:hypothetical protein